MSLIKSSCPFVLFCVCILFILCTGGIRVRLVANNGRELGNGGLWELRIPNAADRGQLGDRPNTVRGACGFGRGSTVEPYREHGKYCTVVLAGYMGRGSCLFRARSVVGASFPFICKPYGIFELGACHRNMGNVTYRKRR